MKKIYTLLLVSLFLFNKAQKVNPEYVDGTIFLKFRTGTIKNLNNENPNNLPLEKISILKELIGKYGITKAYKPFYQADDDIRLTHILQLEFTKASKINELIEDLFQNRIVEYAEKVMLLKTHATPNDPTVGAHLTQIGAQNAWNIWNSTANGNSTITVAVVDNAVDRSHPDLSGNIWVNPGEIAGNLADDDNNGYIDDVNGWDPADGDNNTIPTNNGMNHGTHCAGIAGASTNNNLGVASIGWNVKIIPVKCAKNGDATNSVGYGYQGIIYAAKSKARVISCSWGGTGAPSAAAQSIIDYAWGKGCIIMASAGNNGNNTITYPAGYNNVYSVANVATNDVKAGTSTYGTWVDISAPGQNILSTTPGNTYQSFSGTSMACPCTAGLAALMLSKYPGMSQNDVLNCISSTASTTLYTLSGNAAFTSPNQLGAGRINAFAAMQCAANYSTAVPIANFYSLTRNVCPGVSVNFQDSSLYMPGSWAWSFQSGTPATSTLTSPNVTWATPGIYNVSLTVSNGNGNNTKIKTGYITVAGPIALPLQEGFQAATFLPSNWSSYNVHNDSVYWKRKLGIGGFSVNASAACVMFNNYEDDASGDRDEMRTPRYNFSNVAVAKLRFDVAYKQFDVTANITPANPYSDTLAVKLTTNCGTSWNNIYSKGGQTLSTSPGTLQASIFIPTATEWRKDSVNISSIAAFQPNVMMSFVNHGRYGQALYLDNINIFLPAPSMTINSPANGCTGIPITFTNNTFGAAGYTWTSNPPATISAPNGTNTNVTFATPGIYSITCVANNGTVTSSLTKTISVAIQPTVALSTSTNNFCSGITNATLTASGASTYSWNTTATTSVIVVSPTIATTYTVTGSNSTCVNIKTITITTTLTPNVSVNNQTICTGGTATITASGAPSYSWSTGFTSNPLTVSPTSNTVYTVHGINGICINTKTVSVTIGSSITIIPSATTPTICTGGTVGLSASGATTYTWMPVNLNGSAITVTPASSIIYTVTGTNSGCNGGATISVNIISPPALNLTPSTSSICLAGITTINASGYSTYTWNPGNLSGSSNTLSPASTQVYTVQGKIGNCNGTQTAQVIVFNYPTVSVTGGTIICAGKNANLTANGASSYSWSSGPTTSTVALSPSTTSSFIVTGFNSTCSGTAAVTVSVNPNPTLSISSSSNPICIGDAVNLTGAGATTYTWNTATSFNPIFISPTVTTSYSVTGTVNGCTSTAVFTQTVNSCGGVGLQAYNLPLNELIIFPNPTVDYLTISYKGKLFDYVIYDNLGRLITNDKAINDVVKLKINDYAKGSYYIVITAGEEKIRRKLIID